MARTGARDPKTEPPRAVEQQQSWGCQHRKIVKRELAAINNRRRAEGIEPVSYPGDEKAVETVGLAFSGGGIRSSAVCLGVLQALNHHGLVKHIDYLSTVSGGGYTGCSFTASMARAQNFVFGSGPSPGAQNANEISDTPAVGHIRNYSNYLVPAGARDLLTGVAIVVRGLVANLSLTLPVVLLVAVITILSNAARSSLYTTNFFGLSVDDSQSLGPLSSLGLMPAYFLVGLVAALLLLLVGRLFKAGRRELFRYLAGLAFAMGLICAIASCLNVDHFGLSLAAVLLGLVLFFGWAVLRSVSPTKGGEFRGYPSTAGATYLVLLAAICFFEFQPFMIAQMFEVAEASTAQSGAIVAGVAIKWVQSLAAITAPVAAAVTVFRQQFADLLKGAGASDLGSRLLAHVAKAAVLVAGLALPLLIWVGYLYLCYWGIANDKTLDAVYRQYPMIEEWGPVGVQPALPSASLDVKGNVQFDSAARKFSAEISNGEKKPAVAKPVGPITHIPAWLFSIASLQSPDAFKWSTYQFGNSVNLRMALFYLLSGSILFGLSWVLGPNANSLHRLYRDRLSKAFLFNPLYYADGEPSRNEPSLDQGRDFLPLDNEKLSGLLHGIVYGVDRAGAMTITTSKKCSLASPYHIINAALNIQGSDFANRRGRNADFFMFSPLHVGSEATGYANTRALEKVVPDLDLATAMAISGAAASSNMGSGSIRSLTPTLALLNVRLGYWLKNPRWVSTKDKPQHHSIPLFLWSEISGRLYENADAVYLTDGGHIENLGVYELLRRRCKVIIAVDAEADAPMNFSSLVTLQRYARIDLGIIIDLPWTPIRNTTLEWMKCNAAKTSSSALRSAGGPHVAVGTIDYGAGENGYLVYIKSSLTGDENDYIRDYARRNDTFPHETTGDQFFSEEQFEVYRALGFHMTHGFLAEGAGADAIVVNVPGERCAKRNFSDSKLEPIRAVRRALGLR
ncbi:cell division protein [Bradyrhizobium nanningense]|uniref:Cell division protein n=1 Tax=Bradyrhizobium nanningense TaxID=1325118 RepID=A0A4Q0S4M5_9BRAD|nr:patatin-like phospholipase family protein [Bradyrhizobium nanningense]RXH24702.1 cell division protein [Bradyrhizobium nanningense]RXH30083.1 cell division protein [Bradyrhizobium nanningense]